MNFVAGTGLGPVALSFIFLLSETTSCSNLQYVQPIFTDELHFIY